MACHRKNYAVLLLIFATAGMLSFAPNRSPGNPYFFADTVRIRSGLISGTADAVSGVSIFKGIPFAAPPVGDLRWKAPQPPASWEGVRRCDTFSASAMQAKPFEFSVYSREFLAPQEPISEDCLYLNVWAPDKKFKKKHPVIVWIHGGGFSSGSGSVPVYDGEDMAKKGIVFVTINYRLGIFGFFAHPDLTRESGHQASGNYAFLDQLAALQWVKQNIAAFGGDPSNVTIAGQSAGAFSVNALVASPLAKGLFQRAIAESGGMFFSDLVLSLKDAEQEGVKAMEKMHASSIAELRAKPAADLLKAAGGMGRPVIDGYVLPEDVYTIFEKGNQNDVPVLTGWNAGDGSLFFLMGTAMNAEKFKAYAQQHYGDLAGDFLKAFPAGDDQQALQSQVALMRDNIFSWQAHTWAEFEAKQGKSKIFLYQFSRVPPGRPDFDKYGAFHSAEIAYALHTLHEWNRPWTDWDKELESIMSSYWVNFATNGDPNGKGLPAWPAYNERQKPILEFSRDVALRQALLEDQLDFLDTYHSSAHVK